MRILAGAILGLLLTYFLLLFVAPDTGTDRAFTYTMIGLVVGAAMGVGAHAWRKRR